MIPLYADNKDTPSVFVALLSSSQSSANQEPQKNMWARWNDSSDSNVGDLIKEISRGVDSTSSEHSQSKHGSPTTHQSSPAPRFRVMYSRETSAPLLTLESSHLHACIHVSASIVYTQWALHGSTLLCTEYNNLYTSYIYIYMPRVVSATEAEVWFCGRHR